MKAKRIVTAAMLIAMYVVLSLFSINLGNMKITLDSLPIIVGAALLGAGTGAANGCSFYRRAVAGAFLCRRPAGGGFRDSF